MAHAFQGAQVARDPVLRATYLAGRVDGVPLFRASESNSDRALEWEPRWTVGSGRVAFTFLSERNEEFVESRLSYYPPHAKWGWTPGQHELVRNRPVVGRALSNSEAKECFLCHSTLLSLRQDRPSLKTSLVGIGCERCHGPGREHMEAARRSKRPGLIYRFRGTRADRVLELCARCHRGPGALPAKGIETNPQLARFQGTAMALSACYTRSGGRLTCTTCHNPHGEVSTSRTSYETTCRNCHTGSDPTAPACSVNPRNGCVDCHMPTRSLGEPMNLKFRMHWIRVYRTRPGASAE